MTNDKAPGLNRVPPNAFEAFNDDKLIPLLDFFNKYWLEGNDFDEGHESQIVPVPKIEDVSDTNKWRGVTLMDIGVKIFRSILCGRVFKIIKANGGEYHFSSTPGVRCQDGSFTLKTLLHLWHNHNLPSWGAFTDLVKAVDISNHKLLIAILARYGDPTHFYSAIVRMYKNSVVRLIIEKIDTSIPFNVGVKQGDRMAPVLLLFLIMAFAKTLEN